jgi:hypothetical protein
MPSQYFRRVQALRQNQGVSDVDRGLQAGQEVGKLLGGLAGAIKGAQKDALANKLMNTEDAPRAALVSSGGPQPSQGGVDTGDPNADLSTDLPEDVSQSIGGSAPILNQAVAAQRLSSQSTSPDPDPDPVYDPSQVKTFNNPATGNIEPLQGGGQNQDPYTFQDMPDTSVNSAANQAKTAATLSTRPTAQGIAPGVSTAGTRPHTGGVQEMELQKEMLALQMQKAQLAKAQAGPVVDPIDRAQKLADLAITQQKLAAAGQPKTIKADKNPPPVDINGQPTDSQTQLTNYVDGVHGKGTMAAINSAVASGVDADGNPLYPGVDKDGKPIQVPSTISIPINKSKSIQIPLATLQTYVKQQNAQLLKQHQPLLKVPGEDQSVGGTADNPYVAQSLLDAKSRASKTWVKLPNGKLWQVP